MLVFVFQTLLEPSELAAVIETTQKVTGRTGNCCNSDAIADSMRRKVEVSG